MKKLIIAGSVMLAVSAMLFIVTALSLTNFAGITLMSKNNTGPWLSQYLESQQNVMSWSLAGALVLLGVGLASLVLGVLLSYRR